MPIATIRRPMQTYHYACGCASIVPRRPCSTEKAREYAGTLPVVSATAGRRERAEDREPLWAARFLAEQVPPSVPGLPALVVEFIDLPEGRRISMTWSASSDADAPAWAGTLVPKSDFLGLD